MYGGGRELLQYTVQCPDVLHSSMRTQKGETSIVLQDTATVERLYFFSHRLISPFPSLAECYSIVDFLPGCLCLLLLQLLPFPVTSKLSQH